MELSMSMLKQKIQSDIDMFGENQSHHAHTAVEKLKVFLMYIKQLEWEQGQQTQWDKFTAEKMKQRTEVALGIERDELDPIIQAIVESADLGYGNVNLWMLGSRVLAWLEKQGYELETDGNSTRVYWRRG